ncbi:antibiotic biosynthesis monooxygenase family protein [Teredinibacter sp. KSP-S5-2]|uniref:putative quinol monooxygenase n=1 Tax=Teredinibacter sp. KSP-S5-2 TaxID=3034506 RepID=UPI0029349679|nr:antibiotic biosynthesis monooxygenase family protein [Teredinibacter sp. KSP-S5-2]WNO10016.1 antibiotic biosynthesis monooxygenase [Teredinibacter sp. KSP-S5-2]
MSITRINEFTAADGKSEELYEFLQSLIPFISGSEGCLGCEVLRKLGAEKEFVVIEKWDSEAAHKKSVANFPKEDMQAAMVLFGAPPVGAYYTV